MKGKVVNYGQGEGQVEIEGIVFGFYFGEDNKYYFTFEEGVIEWGRAKVLVDAILNKIQKEFGNDIKLLANGPLTNEADI
jgi:inosine-uridine nucleoside N-ribohydrolase